MDDKERIELIIKEKGLTNIEFSAKTGIAPASLSHIFSRRSKPTLTILRSIISAFPDLNPNWVFMGIGEMYQSDNASATDSIPSKNTDNNFGQNTDHEMARPLTEGVSLDLFGGMMDPAPSSPANSTSHAAAGAGKKSASTVSATLSDTSVSVTDIVKETMTQIRMPQRRIMEVRIFFDDGTYQAFSPGY